MIYSDTTPVAFYDPLPANVDVVVIGAGIAGVASAWYLRRHGVSVLLCEKGRVAGEQSSRNWGWVRQQGRDAVELPIMIESSRLWGELATAIGEDVGFARQGVFYLAETEQELDAYERWLDIAKQHQLDTRLLNGDQVDRHMPGLVGQWLGALHTPSDGRAEPFVAVPALARAAQREGVAVVENCAVRTLDMEAGRVAGVVTEKGRVRAGAVLCAGGAWSSMFLRNLGVDLPQLSVRATVARTAPSSWTFEGNGATCDLAFRRRVDGGYSIALGTSSEHFVGTETLRYFRPFLPSLRQRWKDVRIRFGAEAACLTPPGRWRDTDTSPFETTRVLNPAPSTWALQRLRKHLTKRLPSLDGIEFEEAWAGMIESTPDRVPVLDAVPGCDGLYLATGFSGHGFGIGPGAGRVMADMLVGRPPVHDLDRFRFSRFSDGSPIRLGLTL